MRVPMSCHACIFDEGVGVNSAVFWVELNDSGFYEVTCPRGHSSQGWIQAGKYQLLFEEAVCALRDGYYRAAVADFSASLERFCEFAFWVLSGKQEVAADEVLNAWSDVKSQSERQLGLYIAAYLSVRKSRPLLLTSRQREFRNDVVHKGYVPTREQALEFGQAVADLVRPVEEWLSTEHTDYLSSAVYFNMLRSAGNKAEGQTFTYIVPMFLEHISRPGRPADLRSCVDRPEQWWRGGRG